MTTNAMKLRNVPALPEGSQLAEHVRASVPRKGNHPPDAFIARRERISALEAMLDQERAGLQDVIREAYARGVPQNTLARWAGYSHEWIRRVLTG